MTPPTGNPLREAAHDLLQHPRTVEDTSGGRGEARCMFCYKPTVDCAADTCPWIRLQEALTPQPIEGETGQ